MINLNKNSKNIPVIDSHCHFGSGEGLTHHWNTRANLSKYKPRARAAGIIRTVLFPVITTDCLKANREVGLFIKKNPNKYFGFAMIHPVIDKNRVFKMIEESVVKFGFCGIKVHRHSGSITREICEVAQYFSIPILYDVMDDAGSIEFFANEYPEVNFIIPHLSSFGNNWKAQKSFIPYLTEYPNVFTDSSGVQWFDLLKEAFEKAGAEKILFGSDGPWLHPAVELSKIMLLTTNREMLYLMLIQNILRLTNQKL